MNNEVNNVENTVTPELIQASQNNSEVVEQPVISTPVIETPQVPTPVETVATQSEAEAPAPVENAKQSESEIKTSGTATEEEIQIDASKEAPEVLDEYEMNKDIQQQQKKFKRNWIFIFVIVALIIGFILCLPMITKKVGF